MLDCSHFRMFVDPCNICAILVRRSFPSCSCAEKTTAVLCRSPHGILPKRNPCTPRCFRAKHVPGAEKWSTKKTVKKQVSLSQFVLSLKFLCYKGREFVLSTSISSNMSYIYSAICLDMYCTSCLNRKHTLFQGSPVSLNSWGAEGVPDVSIQLQAQFAMKPTTRVVLKLPPLNSKQVWKRLVQVRYLSKHANTATFRDMSPCKQLKYRSYGWERMSKLHL